MPSWIGPWEIVILSPSLIAGCVALVFYLITAQTALSRCAVERRTMAPGLVWLAMIPVFGFVWIIVVAVALARSLGSEFKAKEIAGPARPGWGIGVAAGSLFCAATVFLALAIVAAAAGLGEDHGFGGDPLISLGAWLWGLLGLAALVCWIIHWVQVSGFSSRLVWPEGAVPYGPPLYPGAPFGGSPYAPQPPYAAPQVRPAEPRAAGADPYGDFCPACGRHVPGTRFCPHCGRDRKPPESGSDPPPTAG